MIRHIMGQVMPTHDYPRAEELGIDPFLDFSNLTLLCIIFAVLMRYPVQLFGLGSLGQQHSYNASHTHDYVHKHTRTLCMLDGTWVLFPTCIWGKHSGWQITPRITHTYSRVIRSRITHTYSRVIRSRITHTYSRVIRSRITHTSSG